MNNLENKVALVTASSRGIGLGVARALHDAGASVCISARGEEELRRAADSLSADSGRVLAVRSDVGDPSDLEGLVAQTADRFGAPVDILVNNNGGPPTGEALAIPEQAWMDALQNNLLSTVRLCRLVVPGMCERGWGRVINLASTTAKEPDAGMVLSNVTRAGIAAFSKTLAREVGSRGVTVNTVLTGGVLTERAESLLREEIAGTDETLEEALRRIAKVFPVGYIPAPDEFGRIVAFLASEEAAFLTGIAIPVDGGLMRSAL